MNLNVIGGKEVSYHKRGNFVQYRFKIREVSVGIDVIEGYKSKTLKPIEAVLSRYRRCKKHFDVIGFLLHQWAFDSGEKLDFVRKLLTELKSDPDISFKLVGHIVENE